MNLKSTSLCLVVLISTAACKTASPVVSSVKDELRPAGDLGENSLVFQDFVKGVSTMFLVQCPDDATLNRTCGGTRPVRNPDMPAKAYFEALANNRVSDEMIKSIRDNTKLGKDVKHEGLTPSPEWLAAIQPFAGSPSGSTGSTTQPPIGAFKGCPVGTFSIKQVCEVPANSSVTYKFSGTMTICVDPISNLPVDADYRLNFMRNNVTDGSIFPVGSSRQIWGLKGGSNLMWIDVVGPTNRFSNQNGRVLLSILSMPGGQTFSSSELRINPEGFGPEDMSPTYQSICKEQP